VLLAIDIEYKRGLGVGEQQQILKYKLLLHKKSYKKIFFLE